MNIDGMKILLLNKDEEQGREIEAFIQSLSLQIKASQSALEAFALYEANSFDLLLVDFDAPKPDLFDFVRTFRHSCSKDIPIIVIIPESSSVELSAKALHLGVADLLTKPLHVSLFQAKVFNVLKLKKAQALLADQNYLVEDAVKNSVEVHKKNEQEALQLLSLALESSDYPNSKHTMRVAHYSKILAKAAGLSDRIVDTVFHAASLHDLGKCDIPETILLKNGSLDEDAFEVMKTHARKGYDRLKYAQSDYLKAAAVICYSHHERYDGTGYPIGLEAETIPLPGRIVAIADTFDALTTKRPYREAYSVDAAVEIISSEKAKQFDPKLVELFVSHLDDIVAIRKAYQDEAIS